MTNTATRVNRNDPNNQKWGVFDGQGRLRSKHASEKLARGRWTLLRNDRLPAFRASFDWTYKPL
jgi:hypothetical protein